MNPVYRRNSEKIEHYSAPSLSKHVSTPEELFILPKQSGIENAHSHIKASAPLIKAAIKGVHNINESYVEAKAIILFYQELAKSLK